MTDRCIKEIAEEIKTSYQQGLNVFNKSDVPDGDILIMDTTACDNCTYTCKLIAKFRDGKLSSIVKEQSGECARESE